MTSSTKRLRNAQQIVTQVNCCQRQRLTSPLSITAKDAAARMLDTFGNTSVIRRQVIDANQLQKLSLTLGRPTLAGKDITDTPPATGTSVPPGYHLVYFTPNGLERDLGADGTDTSFNAPSPFTRRMWAGGEMKWPSANDPHAKSAILCVGDEAEERTRLVSAVTKKSRSAGEMVLVEVEKEIWGPRGLAVVDRRSWVFRPELEPHDQVRPLKLSKADNRAPSEVKDIDGQNGEYHKSMRTRYLRCLGIPARQFRWSSVGLFRFSALTFNGHKIHFNEDWTRNVEGHPGPVVHGPLNLINMLDYWRDVHGNGSDPSGIKYRAMAPIYAGETYEIRTKNIYEDESARTWEAFADKNGFVCMEGKILGR